LGQSTNIAFEGDEVGAAGGTVILDVAYRCGGTAGGYAHGPGFAVGGGTAMVFETCEDVFVAEKALQYGVPGAKDFLTAILDRRVSDFTARRAVVDNGVNPSTRD